MKERIVMLFLFALGTYKVYDNVSSDEDWDDDSKEPMRAHKIGKRSINNMLADWANERILDEELVEAVNTRLTDRLRSKCAEVVSEECSCRRLVCFDESECKRPSTKSSKSKSSSTPVPSLKYPSDSSGLSTFKEIRCRQTIMFGQRLCECKRYTIQNGTGQLNLGSPEGTLSNQPIEPVDEVPLGVGDRFKPDNRGGMRLSGGGS